MSMLDQFTELPEQEKKLFTALMVYDVTLACLEPFINEVWKEFLTGQIEEARKAYQNATGDEPFELRRRA